MIEKPRATRPYQAPLAAAAKFPQLSRPTGRRQPDARSIDEPSPATPRLFEPVLCLGPDPVGMRHAVKQPAAGRCRGRGFQRPVRGYQPQDLRLQPGGRSQRAGAGRQGLPCSAARPGSRFVARLSSQSACAADFRKQRAARRFRGRRTDVCAFTLNSTLGVGGLIDVAGRWGELPYHEQDLGVTFGVWGIPEGPYLVVPVLGPSDPRDLVGQTAEGFGDPFNRLVTGNPYTLYWIPFVRGGVSGIDQRSRYIETLADIERTSLDYYATIRSLYRQRRAALMRREKEQNLPPPASFSRNDNPVAPVHPPPQAAMVSEAQTVSEVAR